MRTKRILFVILIVFLSLFGIAIFLLSRADNFLEKKVKSSLESYIDTTPDRLYDFAYETLQIDVFGGSILLENISVTPRDTGMDSLRNNRLKSIVALQLGRLSLENLSLYDLLKNNTIEIDKLAIIDLDFKYYMNDSIKSKESPTPVQHIFSEKLKYGRIHELDIKNVSLSIEEIHHPDSIYVSLDSSDLLIMEFFVDKNTTEKTELISYDGLTARSKNIKINAVKDYRLSLDSLLIDSYTNSVTLHSLSFVPKSFDFQSMSKQFARAVFIVDIQEIALNSLNIFSNEQLDRIDIGKITIEKPSITESTDRRWPKPMYERILPTANIRSIPIPVKIDSIEVRNGSVLYREFSEDDKPPLLLTFSQTFASGFNLTNDSVILESNPDFTFFANSVILDSGKLELQANFHILTDDESFSINVKVDTMSLATLNPVIEGQMNVDVLGQINDLEMNFDGNKYGTTGDFALDYSDLKLHAFKVKETKKGEITKSHWLINLLINPILKSNNHRDKDGFNVGIVNYERPPDDSFFTMIWQSLKSGLVTTVVPGQLKKEEKKQKSDRAE